MNNAKNQNLNHSKVIQQERQEQQEAWYKLVVKILYWKEHPLSNKVLSKISALEWGVYKEKITRINVFYGKRKTEDKLKETEERIKSNNGFE